MREDSFIDQATNAERQRTKAEILRRANDHAWHAVSFALNELLAEVSGGPPPETCDSTEPSYDLCGVISSLPEKIENEANSCLEIIGTLREKLVGV